VDAWLTSSKGPKRAYWVIARAEQISGEIRGSVGHDDQGPLPCARGLPAGSTGLVRATGLVDSKPVDGTPGKSLALRPCSAPNPRAAAEYYPAAYWASLIKIPTKSDFPMPIQPAPPIAGAPDHQGLRTPNNRAKDPPPPSVFMNPGTSGSRSSRDADLPPDGEKSTREIPSKHRDVSVQCTRVGAAGFSGQVGAECWASKVLGKSDEGRTVRQTGPDRIAKGELPPVPPRPAGVERQRGDYMWNWPVPPHSCTANESARVGRKPTVNASGRCMARDGPGLRQG